MNKNGEIVPIILFTGAGASCAKGIELPNMTGFFKLIMDKGHNPIDEFIRNKAYFKYVMDCMYSDKGGIYDLEKVLSTLYNLASTFSDDAAFKIMNERTLAERIGNALNAFLLPKSIDVRGVLPQAVDVINGTMTQRYTEIKQSAKDLLYDLELIVRKIYSDVNLVGIYSTYGTLFKDLFEIVEFEIASDKNKSGKLMFPIFTTNYDCSIDYVLRPSAKKECVELHKEWKNNVSKYMFTDGFIQHEYGAYFVWRKNAFDVSSDNEIVIPYHKLHGSALWENRDGEVMLTTDPISDLSQRPREFSMIYPSDKSTPERDPYSFSHLELDRYIRKTKLLIIIGFAFRDPGIVNIFKRGLRENKQLNVLVVGPKPNEWEGEFEEFLSQERVFQIEGYFGEEDIHKKLVQEIKGILAGVEIN